MKKIQLFLLAMAMATSMFPMFSLDGCKTKGLTELGNLETFEYDYGSFNGGYWRFEITKADDGVAGSDSEYLFIAQGSNGIDLDVEAYVGQDTLDDLAAIIVSNDILSWDGFSGSDNDVLDGYSFTLKVESTEGTIFASAYMKLPDNYDQGHAALSKYLVDLADRLGNTDSGRF